MTTEIVLEKETEKWLRVLEERYNKAQILDKTANNEMENVKAYLSDSKHFLSKKDFVKAFEAVMYAYGIYEACFRMDLIKEGNEKR